MGHARAKRARRCSAACTRPVYSLQPPTSRSLHIDTPVVWCPFTTHPSICNPLPLSLPLLQSKLPKMRRNWLKLLQCSGELTLVQSQPVICFASSSSAAQTHGSKARSSASAATAWQLPVGDQRMRVSVRFSAILCDRYLVSASHHDNFLDL